MFSRKTDWARFSFSVKLGAIYSTFFVISSVSLFVLAYLFIGNVIEQREREGILVRMREYIAWLEEGGIEALQERFYQQADFITDVYFVQILGPYNHTVLVSVPPNSETFNSSLWNHIDPTQTDTWYIVKDENRKGTWTFYSTPLSNNTVMQIGKRSSESYQLLRYFRNLFLWFAIPILILGLMIGGILTFRMLHPIRSVIQTVQKIINTGELKERVQERKDRGELDQLARLFNRMLDKNESLIQAMRDSLDNVAHDLKTPMTRLRGIAELSLNNPDDHVAALEALADCMEESEKVVSLLNSLMDVSEAEAGVMKLNRVSVLLEDIVLSVAELYEFVAEESGIRIETDISETVRITADKNRIQQALANLVDNAIKYSEKETTVTIRLRQGDQWICLEVQDEGMGIAPSEMERIWDRLYRGDSSRSRKGMGLGLSFVKAIAAAHDGKVEVDSTLNRGSLFRIWLPLKG